MTAQGLLLVVFGIAFGYAMGYVTAWRLARKLEHHEVVLAEWDQPWDAHAQKSWASNLTPMRRDKTS